MWIIKLLTMTIYPMKHRFKFSHPFKIKSPFRTTLYEILTDNRLNNLFHNSKKSTKFFT